MALVLVNTQLLCCWPAAHACRDGNWRLTFVLGVITAWRRHERTETSEMAEEGKWSV